MRLLQSPGTEQWLLAIVLCLTLAAVGASRADTGAKAAASELVTPYTVFECGPDPEGGRVCLVDRKTYLGWRTYHAFCHVCHAQDAVGSTFAPSLLDKLKLIDKERFVSSLDNGYTGQMGVMPAWKENPNVSKRYEELYAYLKARSDGVLLPGRPKWKKPDE